ncbi:hypothetical protein RvY_07937 [Ramazzottius varieornatus]|uniref:Gustatory receptor n=1 Tax=Ramazzottius varieornatus TaxID=947166 RepID=A0A1D1V8W9_RAMVA|nr:hypothetical protein RvY_07937 [Ramazzottius varieornatus]
MMCHPRSRKFHTACVNILTKLLYYTGLLPHTDSKRTLLYSFRTGVVIGAAFIALTFEVISNVQNLINFSRQKNGAKVVQVVYAAKYVIRVTVTFIVIVVFSRSSRGLQRVSDELGGVPKDQHAFAFSEQSSKSIWLPFITLLTFVVYYLSHCVTRVYTMLINETTYAEFPGGILTAAQEDVVVLVTRNSTEAVRVLCAGYLGHLLITFANKQVREAETILRTEMGDSENPEVLETVLRSAWVTRERTLGISRIIERELQLLLTVVLVADILSIASCVGEVLAPENVFKSVRLLTYMLLYVVSSVNIFTGLIKITDKDQSTYVALQEVQSRIALISDSQPPTKKPGGLVGVSIISAQQLLKDCTFGQFHSNSRPSTSSKTDIRSLLEDLQIFSFSCFGPRKISPELRAFGHVNETTIIKIIGVFIALFAFLFEQNDQPVLSHVSPNGFFSSAVSLNSFTNTTMRD